MTDLDLGYLGPECSHSHQAALALLSPWQRQWEPSLVSYSSLESLLVAVGENPSLVGLLPIENALEGSVFQVLETLGLQKQPVQPFYEFLLPVLHCLIQKEAGDIQTVISHPQALGQCRETLMDLLGPQLQLQVASSTSEAVRSLSEQPENTAAIGSQAAAERYGMTIVKTDISDSPGNVTRFFLLGHPEQRSKLPHLPINSKKTSFCLGLPNYPGSLLDLLQHFKRYDVDLSKIESRPSKKRMGEYLFYIDAQGDLTSEAYAPLLRSLKEATVYLQVLGPYACLGLLSV